MHRRTRNGLRVISALTVGTLTALHGGVHGGGGAALASAAAPSPKPRAQAGKGRAAPSHVSPVVEACVGHHTDAQELRMAGKLLESRVALRLCAAEACPALLQRDCVGWLDQLEPQIPSLTFRITVDGQSRSDAQVFIDGVATTEPSQGKAVDLDPGPHQVRVEIAGLPPHEEQVLLSEGERYRLLEISLRAPARPPPPPPPPPELHRPIPVATYILGGVAVAGAVSGALWTISTLSRESELEDTCAPSCAPGRVDDLRRRALLADVSWGVSLLSLAGAATFYFTRPELPVDVSVALSPSGGVGFITVDAF